MRREILRTNREDEGLRTSPSAAQIPGLGAAPGATPMAITSANTPWNSQVINQSQGNATPGAAPAQDNYQDILMRFIKSMTGPLDLNDPSVKTILNGAYSAAGADAASRGIQGPGSINAAQQGYMGAAANLDMQRKQLGLGAIGTGTGYQLGLGNLGLQQGQLDYESKLNQWKFNQSQNQGLGSGIGGALGGVGGFLVGGPAGALAGSQIGSSIGGGIGSGAGGPPPSYGPGRLSQGGF